MAKPRMSVNEVMNDMRSRGFPVSPKTFNESIDAGVFPFVHILGYTETGKRNLLILRREYEAWARDYLD